MSLSVGSAARMRVSSVIRRFSSSGTLKSARTSARLPWISLSRRSRTVRFCTSAQAGADESQQVYAAAGIAPFVVIPSRDFDKRAVHDVRDLRIENARCRIPDVVTRDELLLGVLKAVSYTHL